MRVRRHGLVPDPATHVRETLTLGVKICRDAADTDLREILRKRSHFGSRAGLAQPPNPGFCVLGLVYVVALVLS